MINILNLDGSIQLELFGVYEHLTWKDIKLEQVENDEVTPIDYTGSFQMLISKNADFGNIHHKILEPDISATANKLTISKPDSQYIPNGKYHYVILNKIGTKTNILFRGLLTVSKGVEWQL